MLVETGEVQQDEAKESARHQLLLRVPLPPCTIPPLQLRLALRMLQVALPLVLLEGRAAPPKLRAQGGGKRQILSPLSRDVPLVPRMSRIVGPCE